MDEGLRAKLVEALRIQDPRDFRDAVRKLSKTAPHSKVIADGRWVGLADVERHDDRVSFTVTTDGSPAGLGDLWLKDWECGGSGGWIETDDRDVIAAVETLARSAVAR